LTRPPALARGDNFEIKLYRYRPQATVFAGDEPAVRVREGSLAVQASAAVVR